MRRASVNGKLKLDMAVETNLLPPGDLLSESDPTLLAPASEVESTKAKGKSMASLGASKPSPSRKLRRASQSAAKLSASGKRRREVSVPGSVDESSSGLLPEETSPDQDETVVEGPRWRRRLVRFVDEVGMEQDAGSLPVAEGDAGKDMLRPPIGTSEMGVEEPLPFLAHAESMTSPFGGRVEEERIAEPLAASPSLTMEPVPRLLDVETREEALALGVTPLLSPGLAG